MIVTSNLYVTLTYFFPQEKRIHHYLVRLIKIPGDGTRQQVKLVLKIYTCLGLGNSCFKCWFLHYLIFNAFVLQFPGCSGFENTVLGNSCLFPVISSFIGKGTGVQEDKQFVRVNGAPQSQSWWPGNKPLKHQTYSQPHMTVFSLTNHELLAECTCI